MATGTVAVAALLKVGRDTFIAQGSDPTWGTLYANMIWETRQPFFVHDNLNTVYLYKNGGQAAQQGLGTVKEWRDPRIRIDILTNAYADSEQAFEALRTAWIADFNYSPVDVSGVVGHGYLRYAGIKMITVGESQTAPWEDRGLVYRRIADVILEIGD